MSSLVGDRLTSASVLEIKNYTAKTSFDYFTLKKK